MNRDEFLALLSGKEPPIAFSCDGDEDAALFKSWTRGTSVKASNDFTEHEIVYTDGTRSFACIITVKAFSRFPAIDWVVHFKHLGSPGSAPSPLIAGIKPLSWVWEPAAIEACTVHHVKGSDCKIDDFLPQHDELKHWEPREYKGYNGRPSVTTLPFFRVSCGNEHVILAIGWTGQWMLRLDETHPAKDAPTLLSFEAGMERTCLRLLPGETIRTPRVLLYFGTGDGRAIQNGYRRLIIEQYSPTVNGKRPHVPLAYPTWGGGSIDQHLRRLDAIVRNKYPYEYYWVDAAWFVDESVTKYDEFSGTWASWVGRWRPNVKLYPKGLKQLGDAVHAAGLKFLLWVEPERARAHTDLPGQQPYWFLTRPGSSSDVLLDLGNPDARQWLISFVSQLVQDCGLDCYRQDFNMDPLPYWEASDGPDRIGMAEIKHVMGLYEVWDTLIRRFPGLLIDNCSSGGRRIDLETTARSFPLWRSDFQCFPGFDPTASQVHTAGLAEWIPLSSTGTQVCPGDTYHVRSAYSSGLVLHDAASTNAFSDPPIAGDPRENQYPVAWHRDMMAEFTKARPYFEGDYYPLSTISVSTREWLALQFHRPDLNGGLVIAFRRPESPYVQARFPLHGIQKDSAYSVAPAGTGDTTCLSGEELRDKGLPVTLETPRSSTVASCFRMTGSR